MRGKLGLLVLGCLLALQPLLWFVTPAQAAGASYYFSPSTVNLNVGQTATITLYVAAADQTITAGDGTIVLPAQVTGTSVSKTGSVFSLWPEEPSIAGATIRFAGGKPAPGYQGASGKILSFTIRGASEGTGLVTLSGGRILYNDANVYTGGGNSTINVTRVVSGAVISSTTHPDPNAWYKARDASLSWTKPSGATTYSYTLSHDSGQPSKTGSGTQASVGFIGLADGVWTFALTTNFSDGKTASSSYTIRIDNSPPQPFSFKSERQNGAADPSPILSFSTTDTPSGIDHYEIIVNGKSIATTKDTTYKLPVQTPGKYTLVVRAFDKAGNTTDATGSFTVEGFPGPVITHWPLLTSVLEPITFKGTAYYDSKVILYLDGKVVAEFMVKDNLSDAAKQKTDLSTVKGDDSVEWLYTYRGLVIRGYHVAYAHQQRPDGAISDRSNEVRLTILWTTVYLFGYPIPTLLIGVIVAIFLSILLILVWHRSRSTLAAIRRRIKDTEKEINQDFEQLEANLGEEGSGLKGSLEMTRTDVNHELDGIFKKDDKKK